MQPKVMHLSKKLKTLKQMRGALGISIKDFHEKITFFNDAFWKVAFAPTSRIKAHITQLKATNISKL
jgi:hypothetical protein